MGAWGWAGGVVGRRVEKEVRIHSLREKKMKKEKGQNEGLNDKGDVLGHTLTVSPSTLTHSIISAPLRHLSVVFVSSTATKNAYLL